MNLEGKNRINIMCPKCHYEYSFNGNALFQKKRKLSEELSVIKAKISAYRAEHDCSKEALKYDSYYKNLIRRKNELEAQYSVAKTEVANASNIAEIDLFIAFKKKLFEKYGKEEMMKIIEECEEEMQYRDYDMAVQNHTNFENV